MGQQDSHCQPLLDSYRQTLRTLLRKRSQLLVEWAGKAAGSVRPLRGTGIAAKQPAHNKEPYDLRRGDRKSVVSGTSVTVRLDTGGSRLITKKKQIKKQKNKST